MIKNYVITGICILIIIGVVNPARPWKTTMQCFKDPETTSGRIQRSVLQGNKKVIMKE